RAQYGCWRRRGCQALRYRLIRFCFNRGSPQRTWSMAAIAMLTVLLLAQTSFAEVAKPSPRDATAVQHCLKSSRGKELNGERCIGVVADPCLKQAKSTADSNACADRELAVWDGMLNETYRRLAEHLDDDQKTKAREMQRAWIESRNKTCDFYWDYYQGT